MPRRSDRHLHSTHRPPAHRPSSAPHRPPAHRLAVATGRWRSSLPVAVLAPLFLEREHDQEDAQRQQGDARERVPHALERDHHPERHARQQPHADHATHDDASPHADHHRRRSRRSPDRSRLHTTLSGQLSPSIHRTASTYIATRRLRHPQSRPARPQPPLAPTTDDRRRPAPARRTSPRDLGPRRQSRFAHKHAPSGIPVSEANGKSDGGRSRGVCRPGFP
jgi:hypothetical protein